jgi:branched-subunit amino acid ABC-type transport system permease component
MGSIRGAIVAGFLIGALASLGAVFNPALENVLVFALMALVLLVRPAGLFGSVESA